MLVVSLIFNNIVNSLIGYCPPLFTTVFTIAGLCLKVTRSPLKLWLLPCNPGDTEQKWFFTNFDEEGIPHRSARGLEEEEEEESHDEL